MKQISLTLYGHNIWGNMSREERISNRNDCIRDMIIAYDADICCFQECNPKTSREGKVDIAKLLFHAYDEVPTYAGKDNFTPIFYKRSRFDIVECGFAPYEGLNDKNSKSLTWAVFEEKETNVRFGLCCTHFWWKSDSEKDNIQRLENAEVLYKKVCELRDKYGVPVFATGDLNCGKYASQGDAPYKWLAEKLIDIRYNVDNTTDALTHHEYPIRDENNIYHARFTKPFSNLDHFFVCEHRNVKLKGFSVDNSAVALASSDHCPMIVQAEIFGK